MSHRRQWSNDQNVTTFSKTVSLTNHQDNLWLINSLVFCCCIFLHVFLCLTFTDRLWPQLTRGSRYPKPSAWWRARRRSAACTPSSGQNANTHTLTVEVLSVSWRCFSSSLLLTSACPCRNKETNRDEFIFYSKRLMRLLIEHALSFLPLKVRLSVCEKVEECL